MAAAAATATATGEGEVTRQKRKKKPKPNHEDLGVAPSQSPQASKPLPSAPSLQTPTQSTAPRTPIQEEAATEAAMRKRKMRKEQKLEVLPLAQNPTSEEGDQGVDPVLATTTKKKHKERKPSPSPSAAAAAETPILELEAKVTKKRKPRKEQEPPGNSPLPVDPGQTQPRGTKAPHVSKLLPAAPFLEVPAQSPAPGASMFEEAVAGEAAMRKREVHKEQKVVALSLAQNPNLEEPAEERVPATTKKKKMHKEHNTLSLSPSATAAAETPILEQDSKVTRKRKRSEKQEPSGYSALPLDPGQTRLHGTNAPGSQMLEGEAAKVMRNRKIRKEQKVAALSLAENTTLEERREDAMTVKMKESKHMEHTPSRPCTSVASKTTIWEQEAKVKKKPKQRKQQGPSGESPSPLDPGQTQPQETHAPPLPAVPFLEAPAQSPAPEILTLEEAAAAVMRKKKICKEQKVAALSLAQSTTLEEQREDTMMAKNKESKHMKHTLSCPSTSVASKTTIWEQEGKVNKKQKHWKQRQSPLPLDPGKIQPQGTHAPPLPAIPFLEAPAQSPAPEIPTLEEAAAAVMRRKICKEQKVVALSLAQNTALEEPREDAMMAKNKESKHMKHTLSCPSTSVASKTTNWEQEAKVNKKQKQRKQQAPSGESPLPLDPGKIQPQGTQHAPLLPAIPFLEAPAQSPAPEIPTLEEVAAAVMRRKICKEQKVVALSLARNTALEEPREDAMMAKNKESKHMKHTLSCPSTSVASKTTNWEQEVKVNKKQKQRKQQAPSGESPLPLDPGKIQPQGTQHAPLLPAIPFLEAPAQSPAPEIPTLEEAAAAVMRRKICKEQKVAALSLAQNTPLEEQREDVMMAKNKDSKHMKHTISSPTSVAAETTIWEQEVKVTEKQKQMKQEQPSGKSALPLNPGQAHCVQPQGSKAPPEQEQEANGRMGSSIKKNNGKRPRVRVLSKCELIKEASKKQPALPEGFVAFSDFVSSCTEQNPDHPSPYSAFFDQFRYNPVRGDHKPPLPRTPDRLARLPPRKLKKKDSGSGSIPGSQDKLHAKEKINPENKMKAKKPLLTRAEKSSDKYRRVPLDQLVPPPRSPHNLLQEKYASDPWKVIVICMLLNLTQGKQVKNIIEGFFECYPDPQSACIADPDKMAGYLACLGLQRVKTLRIQRFSKEYVEKEWTYITELCGVGKYAADAYAIFCAGRATEVVPQDHKLVDYWKYVCFELPMMQKSQNAQEAGVPEQELAVMC